MNELKLSTSHETPFISEGRALSDRNEEILETNPANLEAILSKLSDKAPSEILAESVPISSVTL